MQEQSQKEEMRAALRGDFERMHARRESEPESGGAAGSAVTEPRAATSIEPVVVLVQPTEDLDAVVDGSGRSSWRSRLLGRG